MLHVRYLCACMDGVCELCGATCTHVCEQYNNIPHMHTVATINTLDHTYNYINIIIE